MSTHNIPFLIIKKKITLNYPKSAALGYFSKGLKKEFEPAVVNKPSVFEPLKVYCIFLPPFLQRRTFFKTSSLHPLTMKPVHSKERFYSYTSKVFPLRVDPS